ncbi:hypothetical protein C8Q75DRAFT_724245 [Abortiporus biennis]|nr:hypothetical protein C8Q75DRAFT_724245 [Abortiporus biennis]
MSKEPNRHQLSSRLSYQAKTPAFLQRLQKKVTGQDDSDEDDEFEDDGSGRPPIPKRPAIPTRPQEDPGSADEDAGDEKPQIVVLREGKHLSERDVENEMRKAKGLPPLPEPGVKPDLPSASVKNPTSEQSGLSFSSSKGGSKSTKKRKIIGDTEDSKSESKPTKHHKKAKKAEKKLLSFDDDA